MKKCPRCDVSHGKPGIYCSRSCASARGPRSFSTTSKISTALKGKKTGRSYIKENNIKMWGANKHIWGERSPVFFITCSHCNIFFTSRTRDKKCCSPECRYQRKTFNSVKKTHIKFFNPYEDKIVDLHSQWEKEIAELLIKLDIVWFRPSKSIVWNIETNQRYLPDFYLPAFSLYLDVKNPYKISKEREKLLCAKKKINLKVFQLKGMKRYLEALYRLER